MPGTLFALLAQGAQSAPPPPMPSVWLPQGAVELFLDDRYILTQSGLTRSVVRPQPHESGARFGEDLAWEQEYLAYNSVAFDPSAGLYRMWYLGKHGPDGIPPGTYPGTAEYPALYAEGNGIDFHKPLVGPGRGEWEQTNIVVDRAHGWTVVYDPSAPPEERFKGAGGPTIGTSSDGKAWSYQIGSIALHDTGPSLFQWDGKWIALGRYTGTTWIPEGATEPATLRRVSYLERPTFWGQWPDPIPIPKFDGPDALLQPYQVSAMPWGNQIVALVRYIDLDSSIPGNNQIGDTYVELWSSRDGQTWQRASGNAVMFPYVEGINYVPGSTWYRVGERMIFPGVNAYGVHGGGVTDSELVLHTLPADRFQRITGPGTLETPPIETDGFHLVLNADGQIKPALLAANGAPLDGYSADDSMAEPVDELRKEYSWTAGDLAAAIDLHGPVRIRIDLGHYDALYGLYS